MKRLAITAFLIVLISAAAFAVTRAQFLNNQRTLYVNEVAELQAAKDALLADANRIDKINTGIPLVEGLIAETLDAELRADWMALLAQYGGEVESWDRDLANWDARILKAQDKVDEIDRLLAQ